MNPLTAANLAKNDDNGLLIFNAKQRLENLLNRLMNEIKSHQVEIKEKMLLGNLPLSKEDSARISSEISNVQQLIDIKFKFVFTLQDHIHKSETQLDKIRYSIN